MFGTTISSAYAIQALSHLARSGSRPESSHAIASSTGIPRPYLVKLLHGLARTGLVEARRGHDGGYRLANPPEEITLREILASVDDAPLFERCLLGLGRCSPKLACPLHPVWSGLRPRLRRRFEQLTLRDLSTVRYPSSSIDYGFGLRRPAPGSRRGPVRSKETP